MQAFQDYYPEALAHCYGCGRNNEHGHQIKIFWDGDETVTHFQPRPEHTAIPGFVYGGLLASQIDNNRGQPPIVIAKAPPGSPHAAWRTGVSFWWTKRSVAGGSHRVRGFHDPDFAGRIEFLGERHPVLNQFSIFLDAIDKLNPVAAGGFDFNRNRHRRPRFLKLLVGRNMLAEGAKTPCEKTHGEDFRADNTVHGRKNTY
uniref:Uncharacterized protein n=1 Tax=Dechloromonas aromatica (strain RCB) TaxID=159087 RepID=Q47H24_DECAR